MVRGVTPGGLHLPSLEAAGDRVPGLGGPLLHRPLPLRHTQPPRPEEGGQSGPGAEPRLAEEDGGRPPGLSRRAAAGQDQAGVPGE